MDFIEDINGLSDEELFPMMGNMRQKPSKRVVLENEDVPLHFKDPS